MRYRLAIFKSVRSIVFFCLALGATLYFSHATVQFLMGSLTTSLVWKLTLLILLVVLPLVFMFILYWKGRLHNINSIWLLALTTISTLALFVLWDFMITTIRSG